MSDQLIFQHFPIEADALPSSWRVAAVGGVVVDVQPGFPSGTHNQQGDGIPHLRPMNIDRTGKLDLSVVKFVSVEGGVRLEPFDVLFNNTNSPALVGKTTCVDRPGDWAFSNHMTRLRPASGVSGRYLGHFLHYLWMQGYFRHRCVNHVNQASISSTALAESVPVAVPPAGEQVRISEVLDEKLSQLDAGIAALHRVRANLKRYRAAVLKSACEGRLVPTESELARQEGRDYEPADALLDRILAERRAQWEAEELAKFARAGKKPAGEAWRQKYKETVAPSSVPDMPLPEGWTWTSLGQACEVFVGATPSRARPEYWNGSIPWVSSGEVAFCRIQRTRETISEDGLANTSTTLHPPGTVLIGMIGEGRTRGQVAILDIEACNNQNCAAIRIPVGLILSEYVYSYLAGQYEQTRRVGSGNNQPALNKTRVENLLLPLPPIAEQSRIVAEVERRLSALNAVQAAVDLDLRRADRLRQSILKRAFEGNLVPQDPSDEPASALLERIRAERETTPKTKKHRSHTAAGR